MIFPTTETTIFEYYGRPIMACVETYLKSIMTRFLKDKKIIMNKDEILEKRQVNYAED